MVDFTHATGSKNHKSSFESAAREILNRVNELLDNYNKTHAEIEVLRKKRASIIENLIDLLKENRVRLDKPLSNCNNDELNDILNKVIDENNLPQDIRDRIRRDLKDINSIYGEMIPLSKELESLLIKLSDYRVEEKDADNEIVVDLKAYKKNKDKIKDKKEVIVKDISKKESILTKVDGEEVVKVSKANQGLIDELNKKIEEQVDPYEIDEYDKITPSFIEKDKMKAFLDRFESVVQEEIPENSIPFTMDDVLTLKNIAENVYGDDDLWVELYNYSVNKKRIDELIQQKGISLQDAISTPGILANLDLYFPVEIKEDISEKTKVA